MNTSIAIPNTIEFLDITPVNPLISKCKIKVCYVGDTPNRNRSIITKEVAKQIAQSLPGSPIVGFYNASKGDFEEHNRDKIFTFKNGKIEFTTDTVPYGFVDLNAKIWFEKYNDNGAIHEYLVTEGYIWTGQFEEAKTILENGKPQSLEFDTKNNTLDAFWTKDNNGKKQFFIINEAVISKLCVMGDDIEPCFEGSSVTSFSLENIDEKFKNTMFSLITEMKKIIKEGSSTMLDDSILNTNSVPTDTSSNKDNPVDNSAVDPIDNTVDNPVDNTADNPVDNSVNNPVDNACGDGNDSDDNKDPDPVDNANTADDNNDNNNNNNNDNNTSDPVDNTNNANDTNTNDSDNVTKDYSLDNIPEYVQLKQDFNQLQTQYNELLQFKNNIELDKKNELVNSFYMLSDEDKKDVIDNISNYSYDDIKSKLCVLCYEKKVNFEPEQNTDDNTTDYSITYAFKDTQSVSNKPAWLKAADKYNK